MLVLNLPFKALMFLFVMRPSLVCYLVPTLIYALSLHDALPISLPASTERLRGERRRTVAVERLIRVQLFRAFQVGVPGRRTPAPPRVGRQPDAVGIELPAGVVEVRAMIVGLAAVEPRTLKLYRAREHPRRHHPERDVRAVLPVMGDRGERIVGGGGPVWKGDRPHRRLAHRSEIDGEPQIPAHGPLVQRGALHEHVA